VSQTAPLPPAAPQLIYQPAHLSARAVEDQCDCACAVTLPAAPPLRQPQPNSPYLLAPDSPFFPLTGDYHVTLNSTSNTVILNQAAMLMAQHFSTARMLSHVPPAWSNRWGRAVVQSTLHQMVGVGLLQPENAPSPPVAEETAILSAWLHITDRCNLRCAYCYLPHHRVDMTPETGQAALEATFRSAVAHRFRQVKLKYAGGEAMLRFPLIAGLHRYAQTLANRHNLALDGVILSNGTRLTPKIIRAMQQLGLRLMISLDGVGDMHDRQRKYANGRGSFADVSQAVDLALSHQLIPDISVTISGRNAAGLPQLMAWLLERDLPFSLNFYRENEHAATHKDLKLEEEKIIDGMQAAFAVIEANLPRRSLLASLIDRANLAVPHRRTCGVGHSYLVFDHVGQVSKCQMQMDRPVTTSHAGDPLALLQADQQGIQNIPVEEKEECRHCRWKNWCTGGCPLATYRATGRYDLKSPNCNIYKALYPAAVRLEGLRLLMYANGGEETSVNRSNERA